MADYMTELHLDFPADEDHEAFVKMVNNELEVLNTILAWAARDKASENYNTEQFRRDTQRELEDVLRRVQRTLMLRLNS